MKKHHTWACRYKTFKGSLYMIPLSLFMGLWIMILPSGHDSEPVKPKYSTEKVVINPKGYIYRKSLY